MIHMVLVSKLKVVYEERLASAEKIKVLTNPFKAHGLSMEIFTRQKKALQNILMGG